MNRLYKVLLIFPILISGCKTNNLNTENISQRFNSLNMNIYSNKGDKLYSVKSPYSSYDNQTQIFDLKETTIYLFKNNKPEYIIRSDKSKLANTNKTINLNGNVYIKRLNDEDSILNADNFVWNYKNSEYLLTGNVKLENNKIILSSNKAILNNGEDIIEFFNPVKYIIKNTNDINKYEINSENAFYNINTKSVNFTSGEKRVRSKLYL